MNPLKPDLSINLHMQDKDSMLLDETVSTWPNSGWKRRS